MKLCGFRHHLRRLPLEEDPFTCHRSRDNQHSDTGHVYPYRLEVGEEELSAEKKQEDRVADGTGHADEP